MAMVDPISDMLTRMRNAKDQSFATVEMPASRMKMEILKMLKKEGFIRNFVVRKRKGHNVLKVYLKYTDEGVPSFDYITRISKPGRRVYVDKNNIPLVAGGMGITVVSTSQGIMTGHEARRRKIGGEVVCNIW